MRTPVVIVADPGVGSERAEVGSQPWAEFVRLTMQSLVEDLPKKPQRFWTWAEKVIEHNGWAKLNRPDGTFFGSFGEFCAFRQPWGLGKTWDEIEPFLVAVAPPDRLVAARASMVRALRPVGAPKGSSNNPSGVAKPVEAKRDAVTISLPDRGNSADYKTAKVKRAAEQGNAAAVEALAKAERGEVKSAAELERLAGLAKPPATPAQVVLRVMKKADTSARVTAAVQAVEVLTEAEREQFFDTCRARGWLS